MDGEIPHAVYESIQHDIRYSYHNAASSSFPYRKNKSVPLYMQLTFDSLSASSTRVYVLLAQLTINVNYIV